MVDRNQTTAPAADDTVTGGGDVAPDRGAPVTGGDDVAPDRGAPVTGGGDIVARLAGAPISWGVCEVPGWGLMLPPARVFAEMAALGLTATELGPIGYLPYEPAAIREALGRHGLRLVGGFVPLVLHHADPAPAVEAARRSAGVLAEAGADTFNAALVADDDWGAPVRLDPQGWKRLARNLAEVSRLVEQHGLALALHPHAGTQVQTAEDVEHMLAASDVGWCLDTGHLVIGGVDPAEFVRRHGDRIVHAHLKDVDGDVARRLRAGELSLVQATQQGLFRPLGRGDARIDEVMDELQTCGYERWLVLEQDTALTGEEPPVGSGPVTDVRESIEYLLTLAPARRERVAEP